MRKILKIAGLELSILFYSPVAWLVLTIFMVQCSMNFIENLEGIAQSIKIGYPPGAITKALFGGTNGLFSVMQSSLYLYLPILTMGLMSRETSSGSIKLLLSSPVKLHQIILGKYLAIIGYGMLLILTLFIFGLIGIFSISNVDSGRIFSGLLSLYLLICTYAAIGLFMSCLTTYQVVAAISTLAVFSALRFVGSLGQGIDFVRDLTYFLSISGRAEKMIRGMVTTKDVLYYLIIIFTFLSLCVLRLKSDRELKPWSVKAGRYALLICTALLVGYLSSRPFLIGYLDVTASKSLTMTKTGQEIAKNIDGELKVTTYANMLAPQSYTLLPLSRNYDQDRLESYKRFIPGMEVNYVYYYQQPTDSNFREYRFNPTLRGIKDVDKIANQMAENMQVNRKLFISPKEIAQQVDLSGEGYLNVRKIEYKGKSAFVRFFLVREQDAYASEAEFMAAVKRLLVKPPKVVFLTGNNERSTTDQSDRGYELISAMKVRRLALINQGFDVDVVDLNSTDIAADVDIVVLADPTTPLTVQAQQKLSAYLANGGNMLITGEPERKEMLNPVLLPLGLQLKNGVMVTSDRKFSPGFISTTVAPKAAGLDSNLNLMFRYGAGVAMHGSAAIAYAEKGSYKVREVLLSPKDGWNKIEPIDPTAPSMRFNADAGDQQGAFPVTVALTRKMNNKEQRILVSGDADFISNGELNGQKRGENELYLAGIMRWLSNGMFPLDMSRPEAKDLTLSVNPDQVKLMRYVFNFVVPAFIAIFGMILLFKRRRN